MTRRQVAVFILMTACLMPLAAVRTMAAAAAGQNPSPDSLKLAAELVRQLGASRYQDREEASRKLKELGGPALTPLREAAQSNDPELKFRAQELLPQIEAQAGSWAAKARQRETAAKLNVPIEKDLDLGQELKMKLVLIPDDQFQMGRNCDDGRTMPVRDIKIAKPFYIGKFEVTQAQYQQIMKDNPSMKVGKDQPVEHISWNNARAFCAKVSDITGLQVRLPTEAEWEYACRAGTATQYYLGDTEAALERAAWYQGNTDDKPQPVGKKEPNAFGLHDMLGNVWEMCEDDWHRSYDGAPTDSQAWVGEPRESLRVMRGGTCNLGAELTTSFHRSGCNPDQSDFFSGFRVLVPIDIKK